MSEQALENAYGVLRDAIMYYQGEPVGVVAARDPDGDVAENYQDCFVRDFASVALVFLADGDYAIVRNFLTTVLDLHCQRRADAGHSFVSGVMPASFRVHIDDQGKEVLQADFGDRAIGRVTPVDSMMWWMLLLGVYTRVSGDRELFRRADFQVTIRHIIELFLREGFEDFPTLLVPDGAFMIDRRMAVYGHPLEIQSLLYGTLLVGVYLLRHDADNQPLIKLATARQQAVRSYIRLFYWLDLARLNDIHRYGTEEFGSAAANMLNIYPESIPDWVVDWLPDDAGYLVGNLGPGRMDFRFFARGNLIAIDYGLVYDDQARAIMNLYEARWDDLIGAMPAKICYPAAEGRDWRQMTGSDPKNVAWSYHNGGNWPVLLQSFVPAALRAGRPDLARRAFEVADRQLPDDQWPEYYDGRRGRLIGRRANRHQTWSASAYIVAHKLIENPAMLDAFLPENLRPEARHHHD